MGSIHTTKTSTVILSFNISRFNLENSFLRDSKHALRDADIVGVIHDVSNSHTRDRLDIKIINLLESNKDKPSILILNKVSIKIY